MAGSNALSFPGFSLTQPSTWLPVFGDWCGPNYSDGARTNGGPLTAAQEAGPIVLVPDGPNGALVGSQVDSLCKTHDIAYSNAIGASNYSQQITNADENLLSGIAKLPWGSMTPAETAYSLMMAAAFVVKLTTVDLVGSVVAGVENFVESAWDTIKSIFTGKTETYTDASGNEMSVNIDSQGNATVTASTQVADGSVENTVRDTTDISANGGTITSTASGNFGNGNETESETASVTNTSETDTTNGTNPNGSTFSISDTNNASGSTVDLSGNGGTVEANNANVDVSNSANAFVYGSGNGLDLGSDSTTNVFGNHDTFYGGYYVNIGMEGNYDSGYASGAHVTYYANESTGDSVSGPGDGVVVVSEPDPNTGGDDGGDGSEAVVKPHKSAVLTRRIGAMPSPNVIQPRVDDGASHLTFLINVMAQFPKEDFAAEVSNHQLFQHEQQGSLLLAHA